MTRLNERGEEILDPTPVTRAIGFTRPVSTLDEMRRMYRIIQDEAERSQMETPEEFNDFDIDEDPIPDAPFAINLDNIDPVAIIQSAPVETGGPLQKSPGSTSGDNSASGSTPQSAT